MGARKSYERVQELLAAHFPKPDVRDLIRRLPTIAVDTPHIGTDWIETEPTETRLVALAPGLRLDHVVPHAQGREPTVANLRLRCRAHNLHTAREHFGREYVRSALERTRKRARRVKFDRQQLDRPVHGQTSGGLPVA